MRGAHVCFFFIYSYPFRFPRPPARSASGLPIPRPARQPVPWKSSGGMGSRERTFLLISLTVLSRTHIRTFVVFEEILCSGNCTSFERLENTQC